MDIRVSWYVMLCLYVIGRRSFDGACCLRLQVTSSRITFLSLTTETIGATNQFLLIYNPVKCRENTINILVYTKFDLILIYGALIYEALRPAINYIMPRTVDKHM
jgi:hypothetical protein